MVWAWCVSNDSLLCPLVDVFGGRHAPGGMASTPNRRGNRVVQSRGRPHPPLARSLNCEETLKTGTKPSR